jgi:hypothetical protein
MKLDLRSDGYVERWLQGICVLDYEAENSSKYISGRIYDWLKLIKISRKQVARLGGGLNWLRIVYNEGHCY